MSEHFTRNTVMATLWCAKCGRITPHRIDDGLKGPCLDCISRLDRDHDARANAPTPAPPSQASLFPIEIFPLEKRRDRRLDFPFGANS